MIASVRHGRRLVALLAIVLAATLLPVAVVAADPSAAQREAEQALKSRAERMDEITAKMRGGDRGSAGASGSAPTGMAALDDDDLAFLGLREGNGDCAGMYESAAAGPGTKCTHGLDLSAPDDLADIAAGCPYDSDCASPAGWNPATPPTQIPCYSTGPYVQVLYVYWGTGDFANSKERIRRSIASVDKLFKISATAVKNSSGTPGNRHVRWAMEAGCKLKITPVKMSSSVSDGIWSIKDSLVSRGFITSSSKYLAYVDNDWCSGGIAEVAVNSSKSSTNPNNKGGSLAIVYDCFDAFDPYAGYGATLGAHELLHTLGAVQYNAPHPTSGHCWDDLAAAHEGADTMCYADGGASISKFYQRCTPTYPETFDCGKDDYFNPYPNTGTYLANYWNTANNKFLASAEPTAWDTVPKPTVKFTKPSVSGATIGGSTAAAIASTGVPGIPIKKVDWTINGAAVENYGTPTTLQVPTFKTRSGGYANGTLLTIGAKIVDDGGLTGAGSTKGTVWNPYVRITAPTAFAVTAGNTTWGVAATATGGRTVTKVDFLVNGVVKATDTTAPYGGTFAVPILQETGDWSAGQYTVAARVTNSGGVMRQTPSRTLYQPNMRIAWSGPSVCCSGWSTDSPMRVPAGRTVPMSVIASTDLPAGIHHVTFSVGGATVATDNSAPYTYDFKTSSTIGTMAEVTARAVDPGGNTLTTNILYIKSVASFGSQTATITPEPAAIGDDIAFRLVTTPPSGGSVEQACLYVDGDYGRGCLSPAWSTEDTVTVSAADLGAGSHVASWHLYGYTTAGDYDTTFELDTGHRRFSITGASGSPSVTVTGLTTAGRYRAKVAVGATVTGLTGGLSIQQVEFFEGGRSLGFDYDAPFTATWNTAVGPDGARAITAEALLSNGTRVRSTPVNVNAVNTAASLTTPVAGATVSGVTTLSGVGIYDMDTALESAAFIIDGVVVNTDRVLPFSYGWASTSVGNGSHTYAMRVQLSDGRTMTTPAITFTVSN